MYDMIPWGLPCAKVGDACRKIWTRPNIFICLLDHGSWRWGTIGKYQNAMPKVAKKPLISRRSGTQYVAMLTKLLSLYCGAHLVESCCKESNISDTNWLRYLFHHIWSKFGWVYDVITLLICIFLKLEYLWNKKRYLKVVNSIFLLVQTTCLCFKMA